MAKFYLRIFLLTVVMIGALVYAFSILGSPFQIRDERFDRIRVNNISALKVAVDSYYSKYRKLPGNLDDLFKDSLYTYSKQYSQDPRTKELYVYSINTPISYQLCADFYTETDKNNISPSFSNFVHKKGHYCFNLEVSASAITMAAGTNKRYVIQSTSLANTSNASGSAYTGIIPVSKQVFADPHIQSVTTNAGSYYSSVLASDNTYTAYANYPTGFFSNDLNEWGLISENPAPVKILIKFKNPVRFRSVISDFTPGCPTQNHCIEWKVIGIATNGYSINLYSGFGGNQPDKAAISVTEKFTEVDITASMTSAHEIGFLYWRKIGFEYLQ